MKTFVSLLFLCLIYAFSAWAKPGEDILMQLDRELAKRDLYFSRQLKHIDSLKKIAATIPAESSDRLSKAYHDIFSGYASFQGDSALHYALMSSIEARKSTNPDLLLMAHTDMIFSHMSSGNFTDAITVVNNTDVAGTSTPYKLKYYLTLMRLYADLGDYANNEFSDAYKRQSLAYSDSVTHLAPENSFESLFASGYRKSSSISPQQRLQNLKQLLVRNDITPGDKALLNSLIADVFKEMGNTDSLIYYKAGAALLDTKSAKRETIATLDLASLLKDKGDIERAYRYLQFAIEDADYYNMRSRKMQINTVQNEIERKYDEIQNAKSRNLWITVLVFVLITALLTFGIIFIIRKLRDTHLHREMSEEKRKQLQLENEGHQQKIADLMESNNMKEEYIGYGISAQVEYIRKMEQLYNMVDKRLMLKQYDELHKSLKYGDINRNRDEMNADFDGRFLKLYPDFIDRWKALFADDDPKNAESDGTALTPEMRIFALMKVGIAEAKDIATFLGYSVNTVNTYKTKAKKRSLVPKEIFEQKIMEIGR